MANKPILTVEVLRQLISYDPETGELTWKRREAHWFKVDKRNSGPGWNTKWAGKPALNCLQRSGYRNGHLFNVNLQSHRAAYAIGTGIELSDDLVIDHINGVKDDNRLCNLRLIPQRENVRNAKLYSSSKVGVPGIMWEQSHKAWSAKINDGKQRRIGRFKCIGQAIKARKEAERRLGYHPNHGRVSIPTGG